jgi:hypothetical protein
MLGGLATRVQAVDKRAKHTSRTRISTSFQILQTDARRWLLRQQYVALSAPIKIRGLSVDSYFVERPRINKTIHTHAVAVAVALSAI